MSHKATVKCYEFHTALVYFEIEEDLLLDMQDTWYAHNVFALPHVANLNCDPKTSAQISAQWDYSLEGQITPGFMGKVILKRHHGQVLWLKHVHAFLMSFAANVRLLTCPDSVLSVAFCWAPRR